MYFLGLNGRPGRPEEILAEIFQALDEDHDGFVNIDELKDDMATVLKGESRTPDELMDETDTNGDGKIDFIGGYSRFIVMYENMGDMIHSIIAYYSSYGVFFPGLLTVVTGVFANLNVVPMLCL